MSMGRVIVTGSSGFIGSALVRHFLSTGTPVIATARRSIATLSDELCTQVLPLDVMGDLAAQATAFKGADTLVHCATPNDIHSLAEDGGMTVAVTGTFRLIEQAVRYGIKRVIYLSTLQVYGSELHGHVDENTPVHCETPYSLNHYLGEEVCRLAAFRHGIDLVALRPSNVYGVPSVSTVSRSSLVPMCFIQAAQEKGLVILRTSGRQIRNFVSTTELAENISILLGDFPKGFRVVNAVSAWHPRILDLAHMVEDIWQKTRNDSIPLKILSHSPKISNDFTVTSLFLKPRLSEDDAKATMAKVIARLISQSN